MESAPAWEARPSGGVAGIPPAALGGDDFFSFALSTAGIGAWELDLTNHTARRSLLHDQIFGYPELLPEWTYGMFLEHVVPEDREEVDRKYGRALETGTDWDFECRIRRHDGAERWIRASGRAVSADDGRTGQKRMAGIVQDITDQKQGETVLHATLQRFYAILSSMNAAIILVTNEGSVEFANQAFCDQFSLPYAPSELIGMHASQVIARIKRAYLHPEEAQARIAGILERGEAVLGEEIAMQDGRTCLRDFVPLSLGGHPYGRLWMQTDITERKKSEEALRRRVEEIERLLDVVPAAVWVAEDPQCTKITGNRRANSFYEAGSGENVSASTVPEARLFYSSDGRPLEPDELPMQVAAATNQEVHDSEIHVALPSGRTITMLGSAVPLRNENGDVRGCIGAFMDITGRRNAEEARRQSELRYRTLHETLRDAFVRVDIDGRILECNDIYCQMLGYTFEELRELTYVDLTPERWHPIEERIVREQILARGYSDVYEKEYRRKDGTTIPVELRTILSRDEAGRPTAMWAIVRDVTERKRAEEALRRYELVVRQSRDVILFMRRDDGRILEANPAATAAYGYSRDEFLERTIHDLRAPEARASVELDMSEADTRGMLFETVHQRKDGSIFPVEVSSRGATVGSVRTLVSIVRDITDRRRTEEDLREADRHKNEFLAALSHELRNPLAPIKNGLYILARAVPGGEQARQAQAIIERQVDHLARLVDDLLDVTRITRNKIQLQRERLELNDLVRHTIDDHLSVFEASGVGVEFEPASEAVFVYADPNRLAQTLGNLLQNAAKFTGRGGRTVVSLAVDRDAVRAVLRVKDNGAGMTRDVLRRLFQPFMQAETTLDRSKGGMGMGLALVKGLVELHGGEVTAHSEGLGHGSEFVVRLPLDLTRPETREAAPVVTPARCRRVLIIEDNVDAAESLRMLLESAGHVAEVVYDGPAGIVRAREFRPDVVLCDIGLPGMTGYEVARAFREDADPALKRAYLVALSGYALPDDLERAAEAGFARHIAKPPDVRKLLELLAEMPG